MSREKRLERYTLLHPEEALLVSVETEGESDLLLVFKGFSSSLMRSTAWDPDIPLLAENAEILGIDRLQSPYQPDNPQYLQKNLTWAEMEALLASSGI
jgi:hypothetical protein